MKNKEILRFIDLTKKKKKTSSKYIFKELEEESGPISTGTKVEHRAFGKGEVTDISEDVVTVKFYTGERKFLFPDSFSEGFLEVIS